MYLNEFGDGPRSTPTVTGGRVFVIGANGEVLCADAETGKEHWRANLTELGGQVPGWGYCESPLVDGTRVVCTPGGEKGSVTIADRMLYCLTEDKGVMVLADASLAGWRERSRFLLAPQSGLRAKQGKVWSPPVIAHGKLYLRDQERGWCFDIAEPAEPRTPGLRDH